jgi:hypothetical protein
MNREKLRELITDPHYGMILNANRLWDERHRLPPTSTQDAAFRLVSRKIQREFVTLWELFDEREVFAGVMQDFANAAKEIYRQTPFDTIVTCTTTSKHILNHVHSMIEEPDVRINAQYLGPYPYVSVDTKLLNFHGQRVLVITDVVATGTLLRHLIDVVEQVGGKVIAALTLVLIDPEMIEHQNRTGDWPQIGVGTDAVELRSLTDYAIPRLIAHGPDSPANSAAPADGGTAGSYDPDKVINIESGTVFPEDAEPGSTVRPMLSKRVMYKLLEAADAIDFRLFQAGKCRFMTAIRVRRFLQHDEAAQTAWRAIEHLFAADPVYKHPIVVSTYDREDMYFRDFVCDRLRDRPLQSFTFSRGELADSPYQYFLMKDDDGAKFAGKHAVIVLATANTATKLIGISSKLAELRVAKITVVCLFNRIGPETGHFVGRVRRLLRGIASPSGAFPSAYDNGIRAEPSDGSTVNRIARSLRRWLAPVARGGGPSSQRGSDASSDHLASFRFLPVFCLADINTDDLWKMQRTLETLVGFYSVNTQIHNFRRLMHQDFERYFQAESITSRDFEKGHGRSLAVMPFLDRHSSFMGSNLRAAPPLFELSLDSEAIAVTTLSGKLSLLCTACVANGDFQPVFNAICAEAHKGTLYLLFAIVFANIDQLRQNRQVADLCARIVDRVNEFRKARQTLEREQIEARRVDLTPIARLVELETNLLFGLAFLAYLDREALDDDFITQLLAPLPDEPIPDWHQHPLNLLAYYGEDRVMFVISVLLYFRYPRFREPGVGERLKKKLIPLAEMLSKTLADLTFDEFRDHLMSVLPGAELNSPNRERPGSIEGTAPPAEDVTPEAEVARKSLESNGDNVEAKWVRMGINLDLILTELGRRELDRKDKLVLFLLDQLLVPAERHNPIKSSLMNVRDLFSALSVEKNMSSEPLRLFRVDFDDRAKSRLDDAIFAAAVLQKASAATRQLFHFTPSKQEEVKRFTAEEHEPGFARDVARLGDVLQQVRNESVLSADIDREFKVLRQGIQRDLIDQSAPIRKAVASYVVPLFSRLKNSMEWAERVFGTQPYASVWRAEIDRMDELADPALHVIVDPMLLREVLRNVSGNVRYNFRGWDLPEGKQWSDLVRTNLAYTENARGEVERVTVSWHIGGRAFQKAEADMEESTFAYHARYLADYGGHLSIGRGDGEFATQVELELVARRINTAGTLDHLKELAMGGS